MSLNEGELAAPDLTTHCINKDWNRFSPPTIKDSLDWDQHISEIPSKATKTMGILQHSLAMSHRQTKEVAYKTLVRPQLEYAGPISHPMTVTKLRLDSWRRCRGQLPG